MNWYKRIRGITVSLQIKIFLLVSITVCMALVVTLLLMQDYAIRRETQKAEQKLIEVAQIVSIDPRVIQSIKQEDYTGIVQEYTKFVQKSTKLDFIVVLNEKLIRYSHPVASELNRKFSSPEDAQDALDGKSHFSRKEGVLGGGLRYLAPIRDQNKQIIGVICVGYTDINLNNQLKTVKNRLLLGGFFGLLIGMMGSFLLAKQIKKELLGLEPLEIATQVQEREIINDAVTEGILAVGVDKKILVLNKNGMEIFQQARINNLNLTINETLDEYVYGLLFDQVFQEKMTLKNQMIVINQVPLVVNVAPIYIQNTIYAAVATLQNRSEVDQLVRELSNSNQYVDALRSQKHNFMNYLHVIKGLIELEKFEEVATYVEVLNQEFHEQIGFLSEKIKCSSMVGFLLGKLSEAKEKGVTLSLESDSYFPNFEMNELVHNLLISIGIMLDNAFDAVATTATKDVSLYIDFSVEEQIIFLRVSDTGIGITEKTHSKMFKRGFSTKGPKRGYGLDTLQSIVEEYDGIIDCYTSQETGTVFAVEWHYSGMEEEKTNDKYINR